MIDEDSLKSIENLHRLKGEGIITEEEFEQSKQRILFGQGQARQQGAARPASAVLPRFTGELPAEDDHLGWITLPLRRYADFTGRSTRREFWMFQLIFAGLGLLLGFVLVGTAADDGDGGSVLLGFTATLVGLAILGLIVPQIAVQARRMHDQDRSGLLVLINLIPYIGAIVIFIMMMFEGTPGENQYGPDPLDR